MVGGKEGKRGQREGEGRERERGGGGEREREGGGGGEREREREREGERELIDQCFHTDEEEQRQQHQTEAIQSRTLDIDECDAGEISLPPTTAVHRLEADSSSILDTSVDPVPPQQSPKPLTALANQTEEKFSLKSHVEMNLRDYQWELALPGICGQNYIICAPTGTGKTRVAGLIISEHLKRLRGKGKVFFVVNKVILTHQQKVALENMIIGASVDEITGEVTAYRKSSLSPADGLGATAAKSTNATRLAQSKDDIIVCTAGCLLNELKFGKLKITDISLIVIDECHHTRKNADYAKIMECYLTEKLNSDASAKSRGLPHDEPRHLPQVVGLTATPGAEASLSATMDHLMSLCARMDAEGGIKIVHKNVDELEKHRNKPEFTLAVLNGRSPGEEFISIINRIMTELENMLKLQNVPQGATHWSQRYVTWVAQTIREYQAKGLKNPRDYVSTLELLQCLSKMLATYMDLRFEDAMEVIEKFSLPSPENATKLEVQLIAIVSQLKAKLHSLQRVDNPMLTRLSQILSQQFTRQPESKAMVFVETKKQAASIYNWILSSSELRTNANICPGVVTGQMGESGLKMSKAGQDRIVKEFHEGRRNLLVATSVLEEGIDIPACNLVIRYQKVTSEIAKVQTQGRARAEDSQSFTVISSDSKKEYQELMNEEKISLAEEAMKHLPSGELLRKTIAARQKAILNAAASGEATLATYKSQYSSFEVDLHCKKCRSFACNGFHVKTISTNLQFVVTDPEFRSRIVVQEHHNPTSVARGMSRTHKIYCAKCNQDFGVMGKWWKDHGVYPVIKCCNFVFKIEDQFRSYKKWSLVPFSPEVIKS